MADIIKLQRFRLEIKQERLKKTLPFDQQSPNMRISSLLDSVVLSQSCSSLAPSNLRYQFHLLIQLMVLLVCCIEGNGEEMFCHIFLSQESTAFVVCLLYSLHQEMIETFLFHPNQGHGILEELIPHQASIPLSWRWLLLLIELVLLSLQSHSLQIVSCR